MSVDPRVGHAYAEYLCGSCGLCAFARIWGCGMKISSTLSTYKYLPTSTSTCTTSGHCWWGGGKYNYAQPSCTRPLAESTMLRSRYRAAWVLGSSKLNATWPHGCVLKCREHWSSFTMAFWQCKLKDISHYKGCISMREHLVSNWISIEADGVMELDTPQRYLFFRSTQYFVIW